MATRTVEASLANVGKNPKSLGFTMAELINDLVALANEQRTDHATIVTAITDARSAIRNAILQDPALRIVGGSASPLAEANAAFRYVADGTLVLVASGQDMPALVGTVTNAEFGIYLWTGDSAGTITQATLTTGASLGAITFPTIPADQAIIGAVLVNPTGTGDFVGGTTDLDDGTVTPNAVFLDGNDIGAAINPGAGAAPATIAAAAVDDISIRTLGAP